MWRSPEPARAPRRVLHMATIGAAAIAVAAPLAAQVTAMGGGAWGPRLDSLTATFATRAIWRGLDLGSPALRLAADVGVWGRPVTAAGDWGLSARGEARIVPDRRPGALTGGRIEGGLALSRRLGAEGARVEIGPAVYHLPQDDTDSNGVELGVHLRDVPIPWLPEVWPRLDAAVRRDLGRFDATHARLGLTQEFGVREVALWWGGAASWDDYASRLVRFRAAEAGLGGNYDAVVAEAGTLQLSLAGTLLWQRTSRAVGLGSIGVAFIH